ncbi:MAG: DUF2183 domain-containing protein [Cryobacterium sp.]|nr:DUF2183 domain-containing protein [Oligoflexia bacterium]
MISAAVLISIMPLTSRAGIRIISDIDDTTKIAHISSAPVATWNALFSSAAFAGMSELYRSMVGPRDYSIAYLTGAPILLRSNIENFLSRNNFPDGELFIRNFLFDENLLAFKKRIILEQMKAHPEDDFIFIGDDTQGDFIAYDETFQAESDRILAIYIRSVSGRPVPPSAFGFTTAYDLVRTEYAMNRFTVAEAAPIAHAILSESIDGQIIPAYTHCPAPFVREFSMTKIEEWGALIDKRVEKICEGRSQKEKN